MRAWTKAVDETLHPACAEITFASCHRHIIRRLPEAKFQQFLNSTPPISVTPGWHRRKKEIVIQGLDAAGIGDTFRLCDRRQPLRGLRQRRTADREGHILKIIGRQRGGLKS
jgi:hypothetical protein